MTNFVKVWIIKVKNPVNSLGRNNNEEFGSDLS